MKLTKFVPCKSSCASQALLSFLVETWQSVHPFVSVARTVCGTWVLNVCPANPSAEVVCCCEYIHSRFWFCELTSTADEERTGATRLPVTVPSRPSMKMSSRKTWKLYCVKLRESPPSLWRFGILRLACMDK